MGEPYKHLEINNVIHSSDKEIYWILVQGPGQHYCQNKAGENHNHKSATIYFVMNKRTGQCFQACTSRKSSNRYGGLCLSYQSPGIDVPIYLRQMLWPFEGVRNKKTRLTAKQKEQQKQQQYAFKQGLNRLS
jgi:hypothetical protein